MNAIIPDPYTIPLDQLDPSDATLFESGNHLAYFERLRKEDPVHFVDSKEFGPFWSVTKFNDIVYVDSHHDLFSSEPAIFIGDPDENFRTRSFIATDPPLHDQQRAAVSPAVAPAQLQEWEALIRSRICDVLDELPVAEEFNWVEKVSIELTTMMLATLFDFPFEERHKLPYWSDVATQSPAAGVKGIDTGKRIEILKECLEYFQRLRQERENQPPKMDFISLLVNNPSTAKMDPMEFMGNLLLLIVGGNDTTRNSMSASVVALNTHPEQYQKLLSDQSLIPNMVSEVIRWQTPLAHMRRVATQDTQLGGKQIRKGEKVVMWYVSGNRDDEIIDNPNDFVIDRKRARHHVSFGFGVHRCMGNRLAEMQLRILWEELLARFAKVELVGEPKRVQSNFVMGYTDLPVVLHPKS
ncbi:MAG: cytochrome P450 [Halioglobus sp.]